MAVEKSGYPTRQIITTFLSSIAFSFAALAAEDEAAEEPFIIVAPEKLAATPDGFQQIHVNIFRYKPFYFLYGEPNTKVQLSLVANPIKEIPVYLGYTQVIIWDLQAVSIPIKEIQFNPDMFYRLTNLLPNTYTDIGVEHLSNGQQSVDSRSMFKNFVRLSWLDRTDLMTYGASFKIFHTYAKGGGLEDFDSYVGHWEAGLNINRLYPKSQKTRFGAHFLFSMGGPYSIDWRRGRQELGIKYNINPLHNPIFLTIQANYGYKETLMNYDEYHKSYRIGLSL